MKKKKKTGTKLMNRKSCAIKVQERALILKVWPLKLQVSGVAGALLNLNAHCTAMSFFFDETGVH